MLSVSLTYLFPHCLQRYESIKLRLTFDVSNHIRAITLVCSFLSNQSPIDNIFPPSEQSWKTFLFCIWDSVVFSLFFLLTYIAVLFLHLRLACIFLQSRNCKLKPPNKYFFLMNLYSRRPSSLLHKLGIICICTFLISLIHFFRCFCNDVIFLAYYMWMSTLPL